MNKTALKDQLIWKLRAAGTAAERDLRSAAETGDTSAMTSVEREDARNAVGHGGLIRGQKQRLAKARAALARIEAFAPRPLPRNSPVKLGAIVEIEDEETGRGRTLFLAPDGAGIELTGPDGDGFLSVITPRSPIGRAAMGHRVGDGFDVTVGNETRAWEITWVA